MGLDGLYPLHKSKSLFASRLSTDLRASLEPYLKIYLQSTSLYTSEDWDEPVLALESHVDLQRLIRFIKSHCNKRKSELISEYFASHTNGTRLTDASRNQAFDLALSALTMVPFSRRNRFHKQYPILAPETWQDDRPAQLVLQNAIKAERPLSKIEACSVTHELSAARLEEYGIDIVGTSDLRQHLAFDSESKRLHIFQQVGFLKAHLRAHNSQPPMSSLVSRTDSNVS